MIETVAWCSVVIVWVVCSVLAYGYLLAANQYRHALIAEQHFFEDQVLAWTAAYFGPIGLASTLMIYGHHYGWICSRPKAMHAHVRRVRREIDQRRRPVRDLGDPLRGFYFERPPNTWKSLDAAKLASIAAPR